MKKSDNLYILFDGNKLAILDSASGETTQKEMDRPTINRLKKAVMEFICNFQMVDGETEIIKLLEESRNDEKFGSSKRGSLNTRTYNTLVRTFQTLGIQYASQVKDHYIGEFYKQKDFGRLALHSLRYFLDKYNLTTKPYHQ